MRQYNGTKQLFYCRDLLSQAITRKYTQTWKIIIVFASFPCFVQYQLHVLFCFLSAFGIILVLTESFNCMYKDCLGTEAYQLYLRYYSHVTVVTTHSSVEVFYMKLK